ncbi:MAG TPA: hypothetical protein VGT40_01890 [Methylomirabilota bacterium]|jgi:hypothetical protein|nr:hypothetical protein [Methylomirabilota bacterium]
MDEAQTVRSILARVGRRLWTWRALRAALRSAAVVSAAVGLSLLAHRLGMAGDPRGLPLPAFAAIAWVLGLIPWLRPVAPGSAAAALDAACASAERFTTALEVIGRPGPAERLVVRDAARHACLVDPARVPHVAVTPEAWLAASAVAAAMVLWLLPAAPSASPALVRGSAESPGAERQPAPRASTGAMTEPARPAPPGAGLSEALGLATAPRTGADDPGRRASSPSAEPSLARPQPPDGTGPARSEGADRGAGARLPSGEGQAAIDSGIAALEAPGTRTAGRSAGATSAAGAVTGARAAPGIAPRTETRSDRPPTAASRERGTGSIGGDAGQAKAALGRAAVPPALRQYILRYFERLDTRGRGDEPS